MKPVVTRLATMAGVVALAVGLSAMAGAAYGASQPHRARAPLSGLARLDRLARTVPLPAAAAVRKQGYLDSVDLRARADGWVVGNRCTGRCERQYTLIEHWNGRRWSRVPSPNPSASLKNGFNLLNSVSVVSARDAWAAGYVQHGAEAIRPLLLHWNGIRWSAVPSPHRSLISGITSVTATSARNAWAVGAYGDTGDFMLLMHWNGVRWSLVPGLHVQGLLTGVTALSARDIWATGASCPTQCTAVPSPSRTLILHWDGVRWSRVPSPDPDRQDALTAVTAVSPTDAWAVGSGCDGLQCEPGFLDISGRTLLLHWNGVRWAAVASPRLGRGEAQLEGVSALSASRAAAAGVFCSRACGSNSVTRPLILSWNGRRWRISAG